MWTRDRGEAVRREPRESHVRTEAKTAVVALLAEARAGPPEVDNSREGPPLEPLEGACPASTLIPNA